MCWLVVIWSRTRTRRRRPRLVLLIFSRNSTSKSEDNNLYGLSWVWHYSVFYITNTTPFIFVLYSFVLTMVLYCLYVIHIPSVVLHTSIIKIRIVLVLCYLISIITIISINISSLSSWSRWGVRWWIWSGWSRVNRYVYAWLSYVLTVPGVE